MLSSSLSTNLDPDTGEGTGVDSRGPTAKASTHVIVLAEQGVVDGTNTYARCEIIRVGPVPRDGPPP